jgi:RNA polymerase sigma factor (TIGR02999 family)
LCVPTAQQETVTRLLLSVTRGDSAAVDELMPVVYEELRAMAGGLLRGQGAGHTLQATALVNEAYVRLVGLPLEAECRPQFMLLASRAMRSILVDHARARNAAKRGGGRGRSPLADMPIEGGADRVDLIALDEALDRLAELDERKARLIELRFFGGLSLEEAARVLGVARSTASEDARTARAWLAREMGGGA